MKITDGQGTYQQLISEEDTFLQLCGRDTKAEIGSAIVAA